MMIFIIHAAIFSYIGRHPYAQTVSADDMQNLEEDNETFGNDLLWCHQCGVAVGEVAHLFNYTTPTALRHKYIDINGRHVALQYLMNPFHQIFEVLTTEKASCSNKLHFDSLHSWFPGYSWSICACAHCDAQLGWTFEKDTGLSNDNSTQANYTVQTIYVLMTAKLRGLYLKQASENKESRLKFFKSPTSLSPIQMRATENTTPVSARISSTAENSTIEAKGTKDTTILDTNPNTLVGNVTSSATVNSTVVS